MRSAAVRSMSAAGSDRRSSGPSPGCGLQVTLVGTDRRRRCIPRMSRAARIGQSCRRSSAYIRAARVSSRLPARGRSRQSCPRAPRIPCMTRSRPRVHHEEHQLSLERFVAGRGDRLRRTAALLAGSRARRGPAPVGVGAALRNWRRIDGDPESYVRRTLYNLATDGWRRQRVWRQKAALFEPAPPVTPRPPLASAMPWCGCCPAAPRQRAVLVLRYFEQLIEANGGSRCSVGTVSRPPPAGRPGYVRSLPPQTAQKRPPQGSHHEFRHRGTGREGCPVHGPDAGSPDLAARRARGTGGGPGTSSRLAAGSDR